MVHFGPFWPEEVHFGPFRSANRTLAIPEKKVQQLRANSPEMTTFAASCSSEGRKWGVRSVVVEIGVFGAP